MTRDATWIDVPLAVPAPREIPERTVWVDVVEPNREEMISLAEQLGLHLEIEAVDLGVDVYGHVEMPSPRRTHCLHPLPVLSSG